jgi:hypothetical protein
VAAPAETPVTVPVEELMVAMPVALLLHVPPAVASARVMVELTQTDVGPVMLANVGDVFTVTEAVAIAVPQLLVTV